MHSKSQKTKIQKKDPKIKMVLSSAEGKPIQASTKKNVLVHFDNLKVERSKRP